MKTIAIALLNLLIQEHEDGDSLVSETDLKSVLKSEFGINPTVEEISKSVTFINSFYSRAILSERWISSGGFMSTSLESGYYTDMTRSFLRDTIETIK